MTATTTERIPEYFHQWKADDRFPDLKKALETHRKNCEKCKELVDKNHDDVKEFIKEHDVDENAKLSKGAGCSNCKDSGYSGRMGVHEVLVVNEDIAEAISTGKSEIDIVEIAEKDGFVSISNSGKRFLSDGSLSMEEFLRVIPKEE